MTRAPVEHLYLYLTTVARQTLKQGRSRVVTSSIRGKCMGQRSARTRVEEVRIAMIVREKCMAKHSVCTLCCARNVCTRVEEV